MFDREDGNDKYNAFIEKFKPKKTTDDCYTPDNVYNAVADWVATEYHVNKSNFVRPFWPGEDYQSYNYDASAIVVDNPPFSILSKIIRFYRDKGIKFFLFAPTLTLFSSSSSVCAISVGVAVTYKNGANVNTSFVTNLETCRVRSAPTLYQAIKAANDENIKEIHKQLPKYEYPDHVLTATKCAQFSRYGVDFRASAEETKKIKMLDAQKIVGKTIFGGAYLLSENLKQEKEKAETEKAEKEDVRRFELSDREMEVVRSLGDK